MLRSLFALALAYAAALVPLAAQVYTIQPRPMQVDNRPRGGFSLSFRYGGTTRVTFEDVGTIESQRALADTTSEVGRVYDDGIVGIDARGGLDSNNVSDDGRTNRWTYNYASQVTPEGDIAFHRYSTQSNGTDLDVDPGAVAGIDMQYDMVFGVFGPKVTDRAWSFTWGATFGGVFSGVNTKTRSAVTANLVTTTDVYSLEGAPPPGAPYSAPSTINVEGTDSSGATVVYTVDNTTLLNNRPYRRTLNSITPDAAQVNGFWQVKGGYYTLRVGPWMRWQLGRRLSMRATAGVTYSFLAATMEYDEFIEPGSLAATELLRGGGSGTVGKNERFGYFGALDAEFWLTERTGFFAGVTVEDSGDDAVLRANGRTAVIELPNGTGFRAGISVLF